VNLDFFIHPSLSPGPDSSYLWRKFRGSRQKRGSRHAIKSLCAFVVHNQPLPPQHHVQAGAAVAAVCRCQHTHPPNDRTVVARDRSILRHRARQADDPATPPLTQTKCAHQKAHGSALRHGLTNVFAAALSSPTCPEPDRRRSA
jgi:hypothetical protein